MPRRTRNRNVALVLVLVLVAGATTAAVWQHHRKLPRRFAQVVADKLYRSGAVEPWQLETLQREHGIRRVVSLLNATAPQTVVERAAAERLGLEWHNVPLTGDGASTPADRERILQLLSDANAPPTLVHCAAGVNRTGLAVGLYRLHCQQWLLNDVLAELRRFGFEDEPQHEDLRQALAAEARAAQSSATSQFAQGSESSPDEPASPRP